MDSKERYYALDEIRCIGDQSRTEAQVKKDMRKFSRHLENLKAGNASQKADAAKRVQNPGNIPA